MNHPLHTLPEDRETNSIYIVHLGEALDPDQSTRYLIGERGAVRYRDAYSLRYPAGEAWIFNYAVLVCWNMHPEERQQLVTDLAPLIRGEESDFLREDYRYRLSPASGFRIRHDIIDLDRDESLVRLALSHAFAQSTKLQIFEERAQEVIQNNRYIARDLAEKAKIALSRKKLSMLRGTLFETSCDITLHFNLLDTPEFFWDYPEVEDYYHQLCRYLDLKPRIDILNQKLSTIHEMLGMLASVQHHKHSAFLEWIIIILIAIDIVIYFLPQ